MQTWFRNREPLTIDFWAISTLDFTHQAPTIELTCNIRGLFISFLAKNITSRLDDMLHHLLNSDLMIATASYLILADFLPVALFLIEHCTQLLYVWLFWLYHPQLLASALLQYSNFLSSHLTSDVYVAPLDSSKSPVNYTAYEMNSKKNLSVLQSHKTLTIPTQKLALTTL